MKKVGIVYDDVLLRHAPPVWHPDSPDRLTTIIRTLKASGLWDKLIPLAPRPAAFEDIARVHTDPYIQIVRNFGSGELDTDTYLSEGTLNAALHAAGAVMVAVEQCNQGKVERAFCAIRPPGHHAEAGQAMGFCIFNNVAVGARYARTLGYERVFIIDFDAHHGNGTQHIFEEDDSVFYFSTHQHPYYPDTGKDMERGKGKGAGYTYNVPILAGSGNKEYLAVYQDILPGVINRFDPDLILVSAGYDIHVNDPHANIRVSHEGIHGIVRSILSSSACPMVFVLEGGYDLPSLGESVQITIEEMLKR
ncbi:MAG: acetoin utilization protein [Nitrospirae bacterium GWC2_56_14]|nr:MAG: acetoin utilization protein [Nitrospirae bacterium GWC2_56_14]